MKKYKAVYSVTDDQIGTMVTVLQKVSGIDLLSLEPFDESTTATQTKQRQYNGRANGTGPRVRKVPPYDPNVKNTINSVVNLANKVGGITSKEMKAGFVKLGFAETSASPATTDAIKMGWVVRNNGRIQPGPKFPIKQ